MRNVNSLQAAVKRMGQNNDKIVLIQSLSSWRCRFSPWNRDRPPQVILDCLPAEEQLYQTTRIVKFYPVTPEPAYVTKLRG